MLGCKSYTKYFPATLAWTLLLGLTTVFFYFPCAQWYVIEQHNWQVPIVQGIITIFVIMNFSLATFMDPGVIPRAAPDEDNDDDFRTPLYRNVEIKGITVRMKWCVTCQFYRPPRCSHCSVCNHCIEIFDHHCPWVNNCIGRRNYRYFFMFLISLSVHMVSIFILCLIHVLENQNLIGTPVVIVSISLMGILIVMFVPIFGLSLFHMVLVGRGRTTNEQITGKFKGGYNPFSDNCWFNCCNILCGPHYPTLKDTSKYVGKYVSSSIYEHQVSVPPSHSFQLPHENVSLKNSPPIVDSYVGRVCTYSDVLGGSNGGNSSYNLTSSRSLNNAKNYNMMMRVNECELDEPITGSQSCDVEGDPSSRSLSTHLVSSMATSGASINTQKYSSNQTHQSLTTNRSSRKGSPNFVGSNPSNSRYKPKALSSGRLHVDNNVIDDKKYLLSSMDCNTQHSGVNATKFTDKVSRMGGVPTPFAGLDMSVAGSSRLLRHSPRSTMHYSPPNALPLTPYNYESEVNKKISLEMEPISSTNHKGFGSEGKLIDSGYSETVSRQLQQPMSVLNTLSSSSSHIPHNSAQVFGSHKHQSYASQVGYFLQQPEIQLPVVQSGGPRTTPSGYPGGPVVPSSQLSPSRHPSSHYYTGYSSELRNITDDKVIFKSSTDRRNSTQVSSDKRCNDDTVGSRFNDINV